LRQGLSLAQGLGEGTPVAAAARPEDDGYLVTALPAAHAEARFGLSSQSQAFVRQRYRRSYARLDLGFDACLQVSQPGAVRR
jgi:hypothetical protein